MRGDSVIIITMKCKTCNAEKPNDDFWSDSRRPSGLFAECKVCGRKRALEWRHRNIERARQNSLRYNKEHRENISLQARAWRRRSKEKIRETDRKQYMKNIVLRKTISEKYRSDHPEREKAHSLFKSALRSGKVIRPAKCEMCGDSCKPHGHHPDYSKPYDVIWLCSSCHSLLHKGKYI